MSALSWRPWRKQVDWRVPLRALVESWNRVGKIDSEAEQW